MEYRIEHDSMGEMKVPADRLWAAQTQRSHVASVIEVCNTLKQYEEK